jgi:hypothetical protein
MKDKIQIILIIIIITVSGFLVVSNIEHVIHLNEKRYMYNDNGGEFTNKINKSITNIEVNISKMDKLNNSYLSAEDIKKIKEEMTTSINQIKSLNLSKYKDTMMNEVEFYKYAQKVKDVGVLDLINQYRTIANKNSSLDNKQFTQYVLLLMLSDRDTLQSIVNNYRYENGNIDFESFDSISSLSITNTLLVKTYTLEYISNLVLESGDISE